MTRRKLIFSNLNQAVEDVASLQQSGFAAVGNWSLEQILDHLNKTMRMATDGPPFFYPAPIRPILRWLIYPKMKRGVQMSAGGPTPKALDPDDGKDLNELVNEFRELSARIMAADAKLAPVHPLMGKFTHEQWIVMQSWHAAHHLSFLVPSPPKLNSANDAG